MANCCDNLLTVVEERACKLFYHMICCFKKTSATPSLRKALYLIMTKTAQIIFYEFCMFLSRVATCAHVLYYVLSMAPNMASPSKIATRTCCVGSAL